MIRTPPITVENFDSGKEFVASDQGESIKVVIFDVGNVLTQSGKARVIDFAERYGLNEERVREAFAVSLPGLETGQYGEGGFWTAFFAALGIVDEPDDSLFTRHFGGGIDPAMEELVLELKARGLHCVVLSDTVIQHARVHRDHGLYDHFDAVCLSHEIGCRKSGASRDPRFQGDRTIAFRIASLTAGVPTSACVMIDDIEGNLIAAQEVGMRGIHFNLNEHTVQWLKEQLNGVLGGVF